MAATLAPTNAPQFFILLRMRRNITEVDGLLVQRFDKTEQHLRQVALRDRAPGNISCNHQH
jgi:hypothetical protein